MLYIDRITYNPPEGKEKLNTPGKIKMHKNLHGIE